MAKIDIGINWAVWHYISLAVFVGCAISWVVRHYRLFLTPHDVGISRIVRTHDRSFSIVLSVSASAHKKSELISIFKDVFDSGDSTKHAIIVCVCA